MSDIKAFTALVGHLYTTDYKDRYVTHINQKRKEI